MKRTITTRDVQRTDFVKNLYESLRKNTREAIVQHNKLTRKASIYLSDGLDPSECTELMILDGISREAASNYVKMAQDSNIDEDADGLYDYSFTFEDSFGKLVSSHEINKIIKASNDQDAWNKAEEFLNDDIECEAEKIGSVERIDE
jgi:hypothetical protein